MAQDNRNRNQGDDRSQGQGQGQGWQDDQNPDQIDREGRGSESTPDQSGATRDQAEGEDMDELDEEDDDRDLDDRPEGGTNRRRSIS